VAHRWLERLHINLYDVGDCLVHWRFAPLDLAGLERQRRRNSDQRREHGRHFGRPPLVVNDVATKLSPNEPHLRILVASHGRGLIGEASLPLLAHSRGKQRYGYLQVSPDSARLLGIRCVAARMIRTSNHCLTP